MTDFFLLLCPPLIFCPLVSLRTGIIPHSLVDLPAFPTTLSRSPNLDLKQKIATSLLLCLPGFVNTQCSVLTFKILFGQLQKVEDTTAIDPAYS